MSFILNILRRIFSGDEEESRSDRAAASSVRSANENRNQNPYNQYYSETLHNHTRFSSQSDRIPSQIYSNSSNPRREPNVLPRSSTFTSTPTFDFQNRTINPRSTSSSSPSPSPSPSVTSPRPPLSSTKITVSPDLFKPSPLSPSPSPSPSVPSPRPSLSSTKITLPPSQFKPSSPSPSPSPSVPLSSTKITLSPAPFKPSSPSPSPSPSPSVPSPRPPLSSTKFTLSPAPFKPSDNQSQTKTNYICVEKRTSPLYVIPENISGLIEKDIVPGVLKNLLSPSTYKDYFAALLYAEDYYLEKWDGFELKNVKLELHEAAIYGWKNKKNLNMSDEKDEKIFVAFEIDSIPEKRPFLLSRDFAFVRPSGRTMEPFQGVIYRVVKSNLVLVEFGEDFHYQHYAACKYDVTFSFNRVCVKRAHQAIGAASDVLFTNFLFPDSLPKINLVKTLLPINHKLDKEQASAVREILSLRDPPPYLVEGPLAITKTKQLSRTGVVVREAVLQICRTSPSSRILICAPLNSTCDMITKELQKEIPESDMFRANAAFRELDGVPFDILPSCLYKGECFSCPSLQELRKFKVILSTFMSSFRLHDEGIMEGHFSHIFLVDASCATEPEAMVALANLANERTVVVITGAQRSRSGWVRSNIARQNGLMRSYFERLRESRLYKTLDPRLIMQLEGMGQTSDYAY